jgi:hypothetical protein
MKPRLNVFLGIMLIIGGCMCISGMTVPYILEGVGGIIGGIYVIKKRAIL